MSKIRHCSKLVNYLCDVNQFTTNTESWRRSNTRVLALVKCIDQSVCNVGVCARVTLAQNSILPHTRSLRVIYTRAVVTVVVDS